jgi:hypothetical protein
MALIQHWKLDDNAASTTVVATVGTNGTLEGGDNTSVKHSATGPGTAITSSFDLNGTDDAIDISGASLSFAAGSAFSLSFWAKWDAATGRVFGAVGANTNRVIKSSATAFILNASGAANTFTVPSMDTTSWYHVLVTRTTGDAIRLFLDGVESSTGSITVAQTFAPTRIGLSNATYNDGKLAWVKVFDSDESANVATLFAEKDAAGGSSPKGPLSNPFMGPFGGPI